MEFAPHVGKRTLDLEVDHDRSHSLAVELGLVVLDLSVELFLAETFDHGDVESEVVGNNELQCLAHDRKLLAAVEAVSGLEDLSDEVGTLEVLVDESLEAAIDVTIKVVREHAARDTLHAGGQLGSVDLKVKAVQRLEPVDTEALLVPDIDLTGHNGEVMTVAVSDVDGTFMGREAFDVANGKSKADMAFVIGLPVLHEVGDILDVDTRAGNLP